MNQCSWSKKLVKNKILQNVCESLYLVNLRSYINQVLQILNNTVPIEGSGLHHCECNFTYPQVKFYHQTQLLKLEGPNLGNHFLVKSLTSMSGTEL